MTTATKSTATAKPTAATKDAIALLKADLLAARD